MESNDFQDIKNNVIDIVKEIAESEVNTLIESDDLKKFL